MIRFDNKVALITGGSRGIGAATAILFAKLGADVAINYYSNKDEAEKVKAEIESLGRKCLVVKADVGKRADCERLVETTINQYDKIDCLVNNAGIWTEAAIEDMTDEVLDRTVDINIKGCFFTSTAVVPHMKKRKSGNIIFVSSTAGQRGEALHSHYAASKGALISLTKSLCNELAPEGIRVNCVAPGWVDTDMSHEAIIGPDGPKYLSYIPIGRAASAEELAAPIVFMASDWASFIVGEVLNVNGGAVLVG
ncbi:MAG: 3-oxoacyl-ACP reductase family protein [candidate division Zixibacteria bacterium]